MAPGNKLSGVLPRSSFSLLGRSVTLDPRTHAVRRDLADVRLADCVFAPHYAAPRLMTVTCSTMLRAGPEAETEVVATLEKGDSFEVLELAGGNAWGKAPRLDLVGYLDAAALELA